jgi:[amino group carrier protein]-L-2-aminoadipate/L-glutamate 6-kinase
VKIKLKIVIKVGGALFAQGIEKLVEDLEVISKEHQIIIVHGGGPQITELGKKLGTPAKYFDTPKGMTTRYTDENQLEIVKNALAGSVNKNIVEALRRKNINAFGFTGLDGGVIMANRKDKIMIINDKGKRQILRGEFSGKVNTVNTEIIEFLLEKQYLPVIGCMSCSETGDAVNVDGDRAAIAVAQAINADKFISLTDVEGVYKNMETKEIIPSMTDVEAENFIKNVSGGMKKKLFAAVEAIKSGVKEFIIYSGQVDNPISDILTNKKGTIISKN